MFITTKGIVLRTYPFRDNKLIAKIFTQSDGLVSFVIKKNKSQSMLSELLTMAEITYKKPKTSSLVYIKECQADYIYKSLTTNSCKIECSIVLCEILNKCVNEQNLLLYSFITDGLKYLDESNPMPVSFNSFFLIKFCEVMGIKPLDPGIKNRNQMFLNMAEGHYVEKETSGKEGFFVPSIESLEIYNLSCLDFSNLKHYAAPYHVNASVFNYLVSYISIHLADLTKLNSIKVLNEIL